MKGVYHSLLVSAYQYQGLINVYVVNDQPPSVAVNYSLQIQVVEWQTVRNVITYM